MGIEAIDSKYGYGDTISSSNALEIYRDRECYNDLRPSQQKYVQKFLTQEQMDQVDYDMQTTDAKNNGKDKIEDAQKAESHGDQTGNAFATGGGAAACAAGAVALLKAPIYSSVYSALAGAVGMTVLSALSLICVNKYDNGYKDRCDTRDNADATNEVMQSHSDALNESMNMMDESLETYQGQVEDFTDTTNANNSRATELEIEIADAEAMGDMDKAKALREELANLSKFDYSGMEEDMDSTREELDEYGMMAEESKGVAEGGTSVADFLKEGTPLGIGATIVTVLLGVATTLSAIDAAKSAVCFKFIWEIPVAAIAAALLMASSALLGSATYKMGDKAKNEFECGSKGGEVQDYVNTLNTTIEDHIGYTESTTEDFDKTDEDSQESIAENKEKAGEAKEQADKTRKPVQKDKSGEGEKQTESIIS